MNKPSYIRLTQEPTADNPVAEAQYNDDERVEFEFDPSVVNDVTGYPEVFRHGDQKIGDVL